MHLQLQGIESRLASIETYLANLTSTLSTKKLPPTDDTNGIAEVAEILQLSKNTIYTKTHKKTIPHRKEGKKLLYYRKEIDEYLSERKVKTVKEQWVKLKILLQKK